MLDLHWTGCHIDLGATGTGITMDRKNVVEAGQNRPQTDDTPAPKMGPIALIEKDIAERVRAATSFSGNIHWGTDKNILSVLDVRIERCGDDFRVFAADLDRNSGPIKIVIERIPTVITHMYNAGPSVERLMFDLSDGHVPSVADYAFSSFDPDMKLIPDIFFVNRRGYQPMRDFAQENDVPWAERSNDIIWRGRLNGAGLFSVEPSQKDNPLVRQRLRMAMHASETGVDFKFASGVTKIEEYFLAKAGLLVDHMPTRSWITRKFAIDIDGFSCAWDNFFIRRLQGTCVLKVESQMGFRQWYYHLLKPFEHYVPIKKDLSDLKEKVDWVLTHDAEAQAIAENGRKLADAITWDAVMDEAAADIRQNYLSTTLQNFLGKDVL